MKKVKLFFLAITLISSYSLTAQVAINTDGSSANPSAMLDVKSDTAGVLIPNIALTGTTDATTISNPAVSLLVYNTATVSDVTLGYYYNSGTTGSPVWTKFVTNTLAIGDSYQGGIIFWLDATGQHGLIAATADQSTGIMWNNGSYTITNVVRDGIGAGIYNTERIIVNQGVGSYAAQLCANYQGGGYGDWYLPSKYELSLLYAQRTVIGGFDNTLYWSSNEFDVNQAWMQAFYVNHQTSLNKQTTGWVRAIRAF